MASWHGWNRVPGGATFDAPAATESVLVFVRGTDNGIHQNRFQGGSSWEGWKEVPGGGRTPSALATTVLNGSVYVFARGFDNRISFNRFTGSAWSGWTFVPDVMQTDSALAAAPGVLLARRPDGAILFRAFDDGPSWRSGWAEIPGGGRTPSAPAITELGGGFFAFRAWDG